MERREKNKHETGGGVDEGTRRFFARGNRSRCDFGAGEPGLRRSRLRKCGRRSEARGGRGEFREVAARRVAIVERTKRACRARSMRKETNRKRYRRDT